MHNRKHISIQLLCIPQHMIYSFVFILHSLLTICSIRKRITQLRISLQKFLPKNGNVLELVYVVLNMMSRIYVN